MVTKEKIKEILVKPTIRVTAILIRWIGARSRWSLFISGFRTILIKFGGIVAVCAACNCSWTRRGSDFRRVCRLFLRPIVRLPAAFCLIVGLLLRWCVTRWWTIKIVGSLWLISIGWIRLILCKITFRWRWTTKIANLWSVLTVAAASCIFIWSSRTDCIFAACVPWWRATFS